MGTTHMFEFMKQYGMKGLKYIKDYEDLEIKYKEWTEHNKENKKIYNVPNLIPNRAPNPVNNQDANHNVIRSIVGDENDHCNKIPAINTTIRILNKFIEHQEVQLIAPTQSGKSDIIIRLARLIRNNLDYFEKNYGFSDICIIICASDTDLRRDLCKKINDDEIKVCHLPDII